MFLRQSLCVSGRGVGRDVDASTVSLKARVKLDDKDGSPRNIVQYNELYMGDCLK